MTNVKYAVPVVYLSDNLSINGDFLRQYSELEDKDKNDLKQYARDEMNLLGIYKEREKNFKIELAELKWRMP